LRKANLPVDKIKYFYRPLDDANEPSRDGGERPPVCKQCGGTGYYGRTGIFELLEITDRIRDLIRCDNPNLSAIRQEAIKNGMKSLQEDGLRQVIEGKTSIPELSRVCK
jgi:type II secretory ATPase GspE/PulE/Tfp pilus assembly ATPase PilB-like protein